MRLVRFDSEGVTIRGEYSLNAQMPEFNPISDTFELSIEVPRDYPKGLPTVFDQAGKFPRDQDYHTYEDGSFCLGSAIKLKAVLADDPSISAFVRNVVDPYLYSVSYKLQFGEYPYGQLAHGEAGLIEDYERLFRIKGKVSVLGVISALGKRKRVANKQRCPCGCTRRLGKCGYRFELVQWRALDRRRWYRKHLQAFTPLEKPKPKRYPRAKKATA